MNDPGKTNDKLVKELQELKQRYDSLQSFFEKKLTECKRTEEMTANPAPGWD